MYCLERNIWTYVCHLVKHAVNALALVICGRESSGQDGQDEAKDQGREGGAVHLELVGLDETDGPGLKDLEVQDQLRWAMVMMRPIFIHQERRDKQRNLLLTEPASA